MDAGASEGGGRNDFQLVIFFLTMIFYRLQELDGRIKEGQGGASELGSNSRYCGILATAAILHHGAATGSANGGGGSGETWSSEGSSGGEGCAKADGAQLVANASRAAEDMRGCVVKISFR